MTDATPEQIAIAERIAGKAAPMGPHSYYVGLRGAALAAIIETTELAAKLVTTSSGTWRNNSATANT